MGDFRRKRSASDLPPFGSIKRRATAPSQSSSQHSAFSREPFGSFKVPSIKEEDEDTTVTPSAVQRTGGSLTRQNPRVKERLKFRCFRMRGVPGDWDKALVFNALASISTVNLQTLTPEIRIYPSPTHDEQVALITVHVPEKDPSFADGRTWYSFEYKKTHLEVNTLFRGMTPLNAPEDIKAE